MVQRGDQASQVREPGSERLEYSRRAARWDAGVASGGARSGVGDGFENGSAGLGCDFGACHERSGLRVCRAAYYLRASTQPPT